MVLQNGEKHNGESYKTANMIKNGEYHLEYIDLHGETKGRKKKSYKMANPTKKNPANIIVLI